MYVCHNLHVVMCFNFGIHVNKRTYLDNNAITFSIL